jgi:DNA-binding PadR family transcriptional regulator
MGGIQMSLEHAILGMLTYGPMSGYDLRRYLDESVRHFWPVTQSQIYRTLGRMATEGWVDQETVEQRDRPDRKVYHITDPGQIELRRWLTTPLDPSPSREPWLIQVFFAHQLADDEIVAIFEARAVQLRERLALYQESIPSTIEQRAVQVGSPRAQRTWQLTLEHGISYLEWELEWIENALAALHSLPPR